ncbi:MAG: hypothetical protein HYV53_02450 [Parcubacteria group bacterium]|nr:hypothetical protein [Parcubacteria group bacterium]
MSLELRGVNFGSHVFNTAGTRNFFGQGDKIGGDWRQHKPLKAIPGYDWKGTVFISKTTTLPARPGNLALRYDLQPKKFLPGCIYVDRRKGIALNDVGLSGPGAVALLNLNIWQNFLKPFVISFMSAAETAEDRLKETMAFCGIIKRLRHRFKAKFGLEFNDSCPNAGHDPQLLVAEAAKKLQAARHLLPDEPIFWKINALTSPEQAKRITDTGYCDVVSVSNTIPWLQNATWTDNPEVWIDWPELFGRDTISPLERRGFGKGGLSGWPLLNLVVEWVAMARDVGITIPIKAEGGIQKKKDIRRLAVAGANAIGLGCVSFLRPWRLKGLIDYGNLILKEDHDQNVLSICGFSEALMQN